MKSSLVNILLVEDNPVDVELTRECFRDAKLLNDLAVVSDGNQALAYLRREGAYANAARPDLVLLDLNLPGINGHEVLEIMKADDGLKTIPVVVLTSSDSDGDVQASYRQHAAAHVRKPVDLQRTHEIVQAIESFWLGVVRFPPE